MSESPTSTSTGVPTIDLDLESHERISTGNDSHVYLVGDRVAKEYQNITLQEVERYVELQNRAAAVLPASVYTAEFQIRGLSHRITAAEVVPVNEVGRSRSGKPLALSRYVEGPNLEKIMFRPEAFAEYAGRSLSTPQLREFGYDLNSIFWSEYPTRVQDEFHYHVCMLSRHLDRKLGVSGLYISKYNVKLLPVPGERQIDMVVTDIALYIDRVEYFPDGA
jgi:hypothetical protein